MMLDVFRGDAFHVIELTQAVNLLPYVPTRIRDLGLFTEEGVSSLTIAIEMEGETLTLVPTAPRGAPGAVTTLDRRNIRTFEAVHLPQRASIMADEVLNLRAFGKQTDEELAMARLKKKLALSRKKLDLTQEHQRMGAIKGRVLDADGTTVLCNLYTEFGVTQQTLDMALDNSATKVFQKNLTVTRMIEDKLGGVMMSGTRVFCSQGFFDALVGHDAVKESYAAQEAAKLRGDNRKGFKIGDVTYEEYRGQVGAIKFIEDNCAYAFPEGVPDLFTTYFAPGTGMSAVGTDGLPYYTSLKFLDHDEGVEAKTQSNPLHICNRPNAIIKLGLNAAALA